MRGRARLLSDGLGRQRAAHRTARPELLRRAVRPHLAVRPRRSCRPRSPAKEPVPISRPNFLELCERLVAEDEAAFEELWRRLGLSVDWSLTYTTVGPAARAHAVSARSCATSRAARRTRPTRRRSGTSTSAPRSRRPSSKTARCRARTTRCASTGRRAATSLIDTTRPELLAACVAVVAHPDDERYQPLFGTEVVTPLYGVARARRRAPSRRSREGNRHRDDLHVRRHHRRRVVARAATPDARDPRHRRPRSRPSRPTGISAGRRGRVRGRSPART